MVPVPIELEREVRFFLMQQDMRARSEEHASLDEQHVASLLSVLNPRCRTLLLVLARETLAGDNPTIRELISSVQWTDYETVGALHELIELVWKAFGQRMSFVPTTATDPTRGSIDWNERRVILWQDLALAVVATEDRLSDASA